MTIFPPNPTWTNSIFPPNPTGPNNPVTISNGTISNGIFPTFTFGSEPLQPDDEYLIAKARGGWRLYRVPMVGIHSDSHVMVFFHKSFHKKDNIRCGSRANLIGKKFICPQCGSAAPNKLLLTAALIDPDYLINAFIDPNKTIGNLPLGHVPKIIPNIPLPIPPNIWITTGTTTNAI